MPCTVIRRRDEPLRASPRAAARSCPRSSGGGDRWPRCAGWRRARSPIDSAGSAFSDSKSADGEEDLAAHLDERGVPRARRAAAGCPAICRTFSVTSSPTRPSPRVAAVSAGRARSAASARARRSSARTGSAPAGPASRSTFAAQARNSSSLKTLSRLSMRSACSTGANSGARTPRRRSASASPGPAARGAAARSPRAGASSRRTWRRRRATVSRP